MSTMKESDDRSLDLGSLVDLIRSAAAPLRAVYYYLTSFIITKHITSEGTCQFTRYYIERCLESSAPPNSFFLFLLSRGRFFLDVDIEGRVIKASKGPKKLFVFACPIIG